MAYGIASRGVLPCVIFPCWLWFPTSRAHDLRRVLGFLTFFMAYQALKLESTMTARLMNILSIEAPGCSAVGRAGT